MFFPNHEKAMRITRQAFLLVVVAIGLLTLTTKVASGNMIFHFKGLFASAFFSSLDGFVTTDVAVLASDSRFQVPAGYSDKSAQVFVNISKFDNLTSTLLLSASGVVLLENRDFQVRGNLNSAKLIAESIEVFDSVAGIPFNVDLSLTWTSTGTASREKEHFILRQPGLKINGRFSGVFSEAVASGTVSGLSSNFTPQPSVLAEIASVKNGQVTVD
jgi:hypothetical protein